MLVALLAFASGETASARPAAASAQPRIEVLFSPGGGCTEAIIQAIRSAKAVAEAHQRGVKVRVVLDKSQRSERYTSATYLHNQKVPVWIDSEHAIAHNKVILIDRALILTGSFNFTKSAEERNAENLLILQGHRELVQKYLANFEEHLAHAEPYDGLAKGHDVADEAATQGKPETREPAQRKPAARRSRKAA